MEIYVVIVLFSVIIVILFFIILMKIKRNNNQSDTIPNGEKMSDETQKNISKLINIFEKRSRAKKRTANVTLIFMIGLISAGMYFFYFAQQLSVSNTIKALDNLQKGTDTIISEFNMQIDSIKANQKYNIKQLTSLEQEKRFADSAKINIWNNYKATKNFQLLKEISSSTNGIKYATRNISRNIERYSKADSCKSLPSMLSQFKKYNSELDINVKKIEDYKTNILKTIKDNKIIDTIMSQNDSIYSLIEAVNKTNNKLENISNQIRELEEQNIKSIDNEYQQTYLFISVFGTRIGAVLILIFLVQLLIRIYRYNIRLSSYFNARADALRMIENDKDLNFTEIINSLSPDSYDIGSAPKSPAVEVTELLKLFLSTKK